MIAFDSEDGRISIQPMHDEIFVLRAGRAFETILGKSLKCPVA
jgi:hypothetical protein